MNLVPHRAACAIVLSRAVAPRLVCTLLGIGLASVGAFGQRSGGEGYGTGPQLLTVGGGPGNIEQQVASIDFAQLSIQQENRRREESEKERRARAELVDSGAISALDLAAPPKSLREYNEGVTLLKNQHSPEAIEHLRKAIAIYPKFVSAHNALGLALMDVDNTAEAKSEFEIAIQFDEKYARSLLNLGQLAISNGDFPAAKASLEKATSVRPNDAEVLTALAYAHYGNHEYELAIQTALRVHELSQKGTGGAHGNAHYVAAAAGLASQNGAIVERELALFLEEDPKNPLAPAARHNLELISANKKALTAQQTAAFQKTHLRSDALPSLADNARLKAELKALGDEASQPCSGCELQASNSGTLALDHGPVVADIPTAPTLPSGNSWTIRKVVDEVALFFAVSSRGHMVNDLDISDIQVRDDGKAPTKVLLFEPQSKLPLRVGLLVDTSGSVQERFGFEKHAAAKFLQQLLTNPSDLAFVAGFSNSTNVVQDFTTSHDSLGKGIESLTNGGGTSLFDAVSFACGKLATYPEEDRVARVLVVLSDGEDNSSHTTLRRAISDAEASGVTIYAISTKDSGGARTDADKVLQALAERSGGEALFPQDSESLHRSFDKLRDIIRSRYLIAYKPADFEPNGKYRKIDVIATKNGARLQVHARKGYHARVAPPDPF